MMFQTHLKTNFGDRAFAVARPSSRVQAPLNWTPC